MPPPQPGQVRVLPYAHVGRFRPGVWTDVDTTLRGLHDWLAMGLVALTYPDGTPPPADLPPRRCCGLDGPT